MMIRSDLIARLAQLVDDCLATHEYTAAAVLATLIGALHAGQEPQLQQVARAFAIEALRGLDGGRNN